jgi:hypothetical protein
LIATPEIGLPSMALTVSPRYDAAEVPPVDVGALGELPPHAEARTDAARSDDVHARKGMRSALQAVCCGNMRKYQIFAEIRCAAITSSAAAITNVKSW